jgi:hypothetical protein
VAQERINQVIEKLNSDSSRQLAALIAAIDADNEPAESEGE